MLYQKTKDGIIIHLKVTPNASKNEISDIIFDNFGRKLLRIYIKAIPDNGKANKELIKFLSKQWDIPSSSIELISGNTSRNKVILVKEDIEERLRELD